MKNSYFDLIDQTYYFPQEGFDLRDNYLTFHGISLKYLIKKYGTPFKITYLPRIGEQIKKAKNFFNRAIKDYQYEGKYYYCYCTKCCHFSHVIHEALANQVHLETSSAFDLDLISRLHNKQKVRKNLFLIHNGFKTSDYLNKIFQLHESGFENSICVLDNTEELVRITERAGKKIKIGIRMAVDEEPQASYYTSRLGIRRDDILSFVKNQIIPNGKVELNMLHFFIDSGIRDNIYYWGEFGKAISLFVELKKICPTLTSINIGGGLPIRNNLGFEFDYKYMISEIVRNIKDICSNEKVEEPDIFSEFGKYTVAESGATIFTVVAQKKQNDAELWYLVNNSLMNTIPDSWGIFEKFILLPINKWDNEYTRVNIGGISCDHLDYYNSEEHNQQIFLPRFSEKDADPLHIGFFHTGAYQDAISGYGGIKHCLIPSPKHIIVNRNEKGDYVDHIYREEQHVNDMLTILGYEQ